MTVPDFASKHNFHLTAKYSFGKVIPGITESYSSGRTFSDGRKTPYYNSLDASISWLPSERVIVYTSLSNILGRKNIYRYDNAGNAVKSQWDRFFYIAVFISLKSTKAYDVSNF
jgi:hypothetical protein